MKLPAFIQQPLDRRIASWLAKRSKIAREVTLSQKRIYIFLSREGILYGLLLLITFITGINYANNLVLGMCFYLASVLVICIHYTYAQLSGLHVKLIEVANAQADGLVKVRVQLSATGSKPHKQIHATFQLNVPKASESLKQDNKKELATVTHHVFSNVLEPMTATFYLPANERGLYTLPRLNISSVYPLGILRTWTYILFAPTAWIWPKPVRFAQLGQDFSHASDTSQITARKKGQDDFDMLDTYKLGESMARVSWRHLASGRGMLTKHFADPVGKDVLLDYANMPATTHEAKLSQLSFAVQELSQSMTPFAMTLPSGTLPINAGTDHEKQALLLLAKAPVMNANARLSDTKKDNNQEQVR